MIPLSTDHFSMGSATRDSAWLLVLLMLLVTVGAARPAHAGTATAEKPTLLGFATSDWRTDLPDFEAGAGQRPALFQVFWPLEVDGGWPNAWAPNILSQLEALGLTAYVEITVADLDALNGGSRDPALHAMANTIADWVEGSAGRRIVLAPLPEMNLSEHPWSGDPNGYQEGYLRIRSAFLAEGLTPRQVRFIFAPNGLGDVGEYDDYYPGDEVVDLIGFAKINRGDPWRDYDVTFQMHIDELRSRVSLAKPIVITQTASVGGPDRDHWFSDMFTKMKAHDQVIGAIYFNRNKDHDYRVLIDGRLDPAFAEGYTTWSNPDEVSWIFDGRMDTWVQHRHEKYGSGFLDIGGHPFQTPITWLAEEGITKGCNPPLNTMFCPDDTLTRGEMAVFVARALDLPLARDDHFEDDTGTFYEDAANRLFEAGITQGCSSSDYCGNGTITRAQMAAFLSRMLGLPRTGVDHFVDDKGSVFESVINQVAEAELTFGCNPPENDHFCPADGVTRGQMAAFLMRALADG